jgi:hypothetical protein
MDPGNWDRWIGEGQWAASMVPDDGMDGDWIWSDIEGIVRMMVDGLGQDGVDRKSVKAVEEYLGQGKDRGQLKRSNLRLE